MTMVHLSKEDCLPIPNCNSLNQISKESREANKKLKIFLVLKLVLMHRYPKNQ